MLDMALLLQDPQQSADRGVAWRLGQADLNFCSRGAPLAVQRIHDLAFPAAEVVFGTHSECAKNLAGPRRQSTGKC